MLSTPLNMVMTWGFPDFTLAFHIQNVHNRRIISGQWTCRHGGNAPDFKGGPKCPESVGERWVDLLRLVLFENALLLKHDVVVEYILQTK